MNDGSAVLFVSERTSSANIYRDEIASGISTTVTQAKELIYFPTQLADGSGFSAVRVVHPALTLRS
ncbi:MAG: hypothetical protein H7232_13705 [Aeromicrobium sp.]|nr:hypothetical protein [Burkholderiales bacterium]